ncbi:MAG: hypothetical protein ACI3Y5_03835, partial [Prevotella sp.]
MRHVCYDTWTCVASPRLNCLVPYNPTFRSVVGFASSLATGGVSNSRASPRLWTSLRDTEDKEAASLPAASETQKLRRHHPYPQHRRHRSYGDITPT